MKAEPEKLLPTINPENLTPQDIAHSTNVIPLLEGIGQSYELGAFAILFRQMAECVYTPDRKYQLMF